MIDQLKARYLYDMAHEMASHSPEIDNKLAGNCITVHFGMLGQASKLLGQSVEFVLGHIEIEGVKRFHFTDDDVADWLSGNKKPRYSLHAWLALDSDFIDLTLASTIYETAPHILPAGLTYIDHASATVHGITYVTRLKGDDLPIKLGMLR